ncbi:uncharacterized protein [Primulina eburnea]|uniref:uncharacterized protein n=1 Tax=Primulina eburnea TaxID=1245227 RepID=UPI003C6C4B89
MASREGEKKGDGDKKLDMTYHLGSSDGPRYIINPIQLHGENYDEWARAIRTSLKAERKFGFVEGTVPKPTTEEKLEDGITVHSMLVSWLTNTIESSVRSTLGEYDDSQLLWNNLKNRFCVVSGTRVCKLKMSLGECEQGKTETVAIYFGRLSKIWDELITYVKVPICKCGGCTCNIITQVEKMREEDYLHHFLIGLDGSYASIRTNLLGQLELYLGIRQGIRRAGRGPTDEEGDKFASRSCKFIFVGYLFGKKGWKLYDLEMHEYFVSRDVKFFEKEFLFVPNPPQNVATPMLATNEDGAWSEDEGADECAVCVEGELEAVSTLEGGSGDVAQPVQQSAHEDVYIEGLKNTVGEQGVRVDSELGRGKRAKTSSTRNFLAAVTAGHEPKHFKEAMKDSGWRDTMDKEILALEANETWTFAPVAKLVTVHVFLPLLLLKIGRGRTQINVLVYVDDLIIAGNDKVALTIFKDYLGRCFHMKDLGVLKYFLGLEVARLLGAKPAAFPMEQNHNLALAKGAVLADPAPYMRLVGRLIYMSTTRPDLAYSVHILSQFMQQPRDDHWEDALRVVRYLKKSPGQGILLRTDSDLHLEGWCDSDWASCPLTWRSLTSWFMLLGGSHVSWKTKKRQTAPRSSAKAEYRSMTATLCELKWLKQLLGDLGM